MLGTCETQLLFAVFPAAAPENVSLMLAPAGSACASLPDIDIGSDAVRGKPELRSGCPAHHRVIIGDRV